MILYFGEILSLRLEKIALEATLQHVLQDDILVQTLKGVSDVPRFPRLPVWPTFPMEGNVRAPLGELEVDCGGYSSPALESRV